MGWNVKKKIILSLLGVLIVGTIVFSLFKKRLVIPKNNLWSQANDGTSEEKANNNNQEAEASSVDDITTSLVMNEPITILGVEYTVNSVMRTKEKHGLDMLGERHAPRIQVDEHGVLINNNSYFIVNVTMHNKQEEDVELTLPTFTIAIKDDQGELYNDVEFSVFDQGANVWAKDYGTVVLKANQLVTYNLGYVLADDKLDELQGQERLWFYVNPIGSSLFFARRDVGNNRALIKLDY